MTKQELFDFVRKFNKLESISDAVILEGLKKLSPEEQKIFMMLVNFKNGSAFKDCLDAGEI